MAEQYLKINEMSQTGPTVLTTGDLVRRLGVERADLVTWDARSDSGRMVSVSFTVLLPLTSDRG